MALGLHTHCCAHISSLVSLLLKVTRSKIPTVSLPDTEIKMNRSKTFLGIIAFSTSWVLAQEHKIAREQLPAAVAFTVDRETKDATVKGYATEREHGIKVYEVETASNGHTRDLQIAADGTLLEVEEEVAFDSLLGNVRIALEAKAKGAQITKVESLTKHGKLVAYEAATLRGQHKAEIQVGPDGESLKHEQ